MVARDIPRDGLDIAETVAVADIGLLEGEGFGILSPLVISVHVEKMSGAVLAHTRVKAKYSFTCRRCLTEMQMDRLDTFDFYFELNPSVEVIDVGEEIRQEILLTIPQFSLCRADCKGICSQCGTNLNEKICNCRVEKKNVIRGSEIFDQGDDKPNKIPL